MNVLIIGSGGREHALAWKIAQSPLCEKLYVATGNAGTAQIAQNIDLGINDFPNIKKTVLEKNISLVIVGPEEPLVNGLADFFRHDPELQKIKFIGTNQSGARLEGSKDFAKHFMNTHRIPTALHRSFTPETLQEGLQYIDNHSLPIVLKADGLAAGKGVVIADTYADARKNFMEMLAGKFGKASQKVIVETYMHGIEMSVFVLTDGKNFITLPEAKDYKRISDGDKGLNTGGMGAVSPVPFANEDFMLKVRKRIINPTLKGLQAEGIDYVGFIFIGIMNVNGDPFVVEYNVRLGDPETEVVLPRIESDLLEIFDLTAQKRLNEVQLKISPKTATTVMLTAKGYPESYEKGTKMTGFENLPKEALAFHAGTKTLDNQIVTNGGRVIAMTALADTLDEALDISNRAAEILKFEGKHYRKDIGFDLKKLVK